MVNAICGLTLVFCQHRLFESSLLIVLKGSDTQHWVTRSAMQRGTVPDQRKAESRFGIQPPSPRRTTGRLASLLQPLLAWKVLRLRKEKENRGRGGRDWLPFAGGGWGGTRENWGEGCVWLRHMCDSLLSLVKMKSRVWLGAFRAVGEKKRERESTGARRRGGDLERERKWGRE